MEIITLNQDNLEPFTEYLTEDVAENIGRTFFNGLVAVEDDVPLAAIVWELINVLEEKDITSRICFLRIDEEAAGNAIFEEYEYQIKEDKAIKSEVSLPAKTSRIEKQFLQDKGFNIGLMEGDIISTYLSELSEIEAFKKIKVPDSIKPLKAAPQKIFNQVIGRMMSQGHFGLCEDLPYLSRLYFDNDISCFSEEDGEINGLFLLHMTPSSKVKVILMSAEGKGSTIILLQMMKKAVMSALEEYDPQTEVLIDRHNYATLALTEKLFPRGFGIPVYKGERAED